MICVRKSQRELGGGSTNPFHAASKTIQTVRRAIFALGGIEMIMGSQNGDLINDIKALMGDLTGKATGRMEEMSSGASKTDPKPSAEAIGSQVPGRPRRYSRSWKSWIWISQND
jgi:hypothetical protein